MNPVGWEAFPPPDSIQELVLRYVKEQRSNPRGDRGVCARFVLVLNIRSIAERSSEFKGTFWTNF
jgi:hypothetical protein